MPDSFLEDDYEYDRPIYDGRWHLKQALPPDTHLPNKNEAKLLRKLKHDTGLTETQIRNIKGYRIALSQSQKVPRAKNNRKERNFLYYVKSATSELKLAKEHPLVITKIIELIKRDKANFRYSYHNTDLPTTTEAVLALIRHIDKKKKKNKIK